MDSAVATVNITVTPVNDAPTAFNQQLVFEEDQSIDVTLTWSDVDGDPITVELLTSPGSGSLSGDGTTFVYTPDLNFTGNDSFTFKVNDGQLDSNTGTIYLTGNPVNDAPVANDGNVSTLEDEPRDITLNAVDADNDSLTYTVVASPSSGVLSALSGDGLSYQPNPGFFGVDQFTYVANDGLLDSNVATITIDVIEKNKPPMIVSDAETTAIQAEAYEYDVVATDPNLGDELTYSLDQGPQLLNIDAGTGQIIWQPEQQYVSSLQSVNSYCSLTAYDEEFRSLDLVFLDDTAGTPVLSTNILNELVSDTEVTLNNLDIGSATNPNQFGLMAISAEASSIEVNGARLYPATDFPAAADQLVSGAEAPVDGLAALELLLTQYPLRSDVAGHLVLAADQLPAVNDQTQVASLINSLTEKAVQLSVIVDAEFQCENGVSAWGVDADNVGYSYVDGAIVRCEQPALVSGDAILLSTYVDLALASGGSVWSLSSLQSSPAEFATVLIDYLASATVARFSLKLADTVISEIRLDANDRAHGKVIVRNRGLGATGQSVTLTIEGVQGDAKSLLEQVVVPEIEAAGALAIPFILPANYTFDAVSATVSPLSTEQECVVDNNTLVAPIVEITVADSEGLSDSQTYLINVYEANESPGFVSEPVTSAYVGETYEYRVFADDPDLGDLMRFAIVNGPEGMRIHPVSGILTWTPQAADAGDHSVEISVSDIEGKTAVQSFSVSVGYFNHAPAIVTTPPTTATLGQLYYYDVNATDADGDTLTYSLLQSPGTAVIDSVTGIITWQTNVEGVASFIVQVSDGKGGLDTQSFDVTVGGAYNNQPPVANSGSYQTAQNTSLDIILGGSDPDGDVLTFSIVTPPQNGQLYGSGKNLQYVPNSYYAGADSFEFVVSDGGVQSAPAVITINVTDINNPPEIVSEPQSPFVLQPATGDSEPIDLRTWTALDFRYGTDQGAASWSVSADGTSANQSQNARASALLSDFKLSDDQISGTWRVNTASDDDFIGFVFGWQNKYQYYLFDWKQTSQTGAARGMTVKAFNLAADGSEGVPALWATYPTNGTTLYHNSIGWADRTSYEFTLTYHPGEFTITVKRGTTVLDSFTIQDDTFTTGKFGFYNLSQQAVAYAGFTREILASREYQYQVEAIDPDGDVVTYTLVDGPEGMSLDAETGLLTWFTTSQDSGVYPVTVQATDPYGATSIQNFSLTVAEQVPVIVSEPPLAANPDKAYVYSVNAYDPNPDDVLSYSLTESPAGMAIDPASGLIAWTPEVSQLGDHNVVVQVTDSAGFSSDQPYTLSVTEEPDNTPPEFTTQPPLTARVGKPYTYTPQATDADGDTVQVSMLDIPYGMTMFDGQTIRWTPTSGQLSTHEIVIDADDGRGGVTPQTFTITVEGADANKPPQITSQPGQIIGADTAYEYAVQAQDPNGDTLTYKLLKAPQGMQIDAQGKISWTAGDPGFYQVVIRVEDGRGGYATQTYDIAVYTALENAAPEIISLPVTTAYTNARYEYQLMANDPDGDSIVYSIVAGPTGLAIDPNTGIVNWVPEEDQLGSHPLSLKAYDGRGGSSTQSYTLLVTALSNNRPPRITSQPGTTAIPDSPYSYQVAAEDPEGAALSYSLETAPSGLVIDSNGLVSWTPLADQEGTHALTVVVADPAGESASQSFVITVDPSGQATGNAPPEISSEPTTLVSIGATYQYQLVATDPDSETLVYTLIDGPADMVMSVEGLINWTPTTTDVGGHHVVVQVSDGSGGVATQTYTVSIVANGSNQPPVINSSPSSSGKAGITYSYQLAATDGDGDTLSYTVEAGPASATVSSAGLFNWTPDIAGAESVTLRVSDGIAHVTQQWNITVAESNVVLGANVLVNPEVADIGQLISVQVQPTGAAGATEVRVTLDGAEQTLDAQNGFTTTLNATGAHEIVAQVTDTNDTAVVRKTIYVRDPSDTVAPSVTLHNIVSDQEITAPVNVVASVSDTNLSEWTLALKSKSGGDPFVIATGTHVVNQTVIGELDPTMLTNGQYSLILTALDASRNTRSASKVVRLTGDLKVGNFSFTVTDLEIPLSGIPIRVNRTYDSRKRSQQEDFGYGWSIDYRDIKVEESRAPGKSWALNSYRSGPFGVYVNYCVEPLGDPIVTITLPNGDVESFKAVASPQCNLYQPSIDVQLQFEPLDGETQSELEQLNYSTLRLVNGNLQELDAFTAADPAIYKLTTKAGYVYRLKQGVGIEKVVDPNGNTLTYTDNGIIHSDGKSVLFERDADGFIEAIVDPSGNRLVYTRDGNSDLTVAKDQEQADTTYTYNNDHALVDIFDPLGRKILKNIYDTDGRLIGQEDGDGNLREFDHDIDGRSSIVTDRDGRVTIYGYDNNGNVLTEIMGIFDGSYADDIITTYTYDGNNNQKTRTIGASTWTTLYSARSDVTETRDPVNNSVKYQNYTQRGQEGRIIDERGKVTDLSYDAAGNLTQIQMPTVTDPDTNATHRPIAGNVIGEKGLIQSTTDLRGHTTSYTYFPEGHQWEGKKKTESNSVTGTMSFTYDDNGNVVTETRQRTVNGVVQNETTTYKYDKRNRVTRTIMPDGTYTETVYDLAGNTDKERDRFGNWTDYTYDVYGRLTHTLYPDNTEESRSYTAEGLLEEVVDRLGHTMRYEYDDAGRQRIVRNVDAGTYAETAYTPEGWVQSEWDENRNRTDYEYDLAGRRTAVVRYLDGNPLRHSYTYYANGELQTETDATGYTTEYVLNALDQRIETRFHNGTATKARFDDMGARLAMIDQEDIRTDYGYDSVGRLGSVQAQVTVDGGALPATSYTYDEAGNKLTQTDANGHTTTWTYDSVGRVSTRQLPEGQTETYSYDDVARTMTHTDFNGDDTVTTYDIMGRVSRIDYGKDNTFEAYTYWPNGQQKQVTDVNGGITEYFYDNRDRLDYTTKPDGSRFDYQYDAVGNRTQVKVTRNSTVTSLTDYTYDTLNRMKTVADSNGTTTYTYDDAGNLDTVSYPNGLVTDYDYNTIHQLVLVTTRDSNNGDAVVSSFTYDLKPSGRRETITEADGRTTGYTYDGLYRLKTETVTDPTNGNYAAEYIYDFVGNRTYETVDGVQTAYQYDDNDRLQQQGGTQYVYDDNGNLLTETLDGQTTTYSYNGKNNVTAVDKAGTTTQYGYNHNGIRISKAEGGITTDFIVDENRDYAQVLEEVTDGSIDVLYSYGHDLLNQERSGAISFYHYDGLGSTRNLSDASGTFTDGYNYEAFGELLNQTGATENSYLFTGEQFDSSLDQYYLRARYYDPSNGRFTSMDSWMGNSDDPVTLHKYLYGNVDPVSIIDPSGNAGLLGLSAGQHISAILIAAATTYTIFDIYKISSGEGSLNVKGREIAIEGYYLLGAYGVAKYVGAGFKYARQGFKTNLGKSVAWSGAGPAEGMLGLNAASASNKAILNYFPKKGTSVEYIFDTESKTFLIGIAGKYKHYQLANSIGANHTKVVGGMLKRGENGGFITNEFSGTFYKNWTSENRTLFVNTLKQLGISISHSL